MLSYLTKASTRAPRGRLAALRAAALLGALFVAAPAAPTNAAQGPAHFDAVHAQRPISDDPLIDESLVATAAQSVTADGGSIQHIAGIGPSMVLALRFNAVWPTQGEITTYFGEVGPYSPHGHSGLDVAGPQGTPIVAMDQGEVIKAYWADDGYGGLVIIAHPAGYETWYAHLSSFDVELGQHVTRGQQIAQMGSTGYSTGSHLHFEVRQEGQLCDPLEFVSEAALQEAAR